jgi:Ca2+-binding EF-hand superfamily protein
MFSDTDELLNTLCEFCVKKNINLRKHLLRYDISKNGKISENDFKRAIEELKLGFIGSDLDKLANVCKSQHSNDISIDNFLNLLKSKNNNFKALIEQFSDEPDNIIMTGNKQASKKYDKFENKAFNIDYGI